MGVFIFFFELGALVAVWGGEDDVVAGEDVGACGEGMVL